MPQFEVSEGPIIVPRGAVRKLRRWLSAITLKATNELYQRCTEHAAHLASARDRPMNIPQLWRAAVMLPDLP